MRKILSFARWELKNILRFPMPEIIVFIMFFTVFSQLFNLTLPISSGGGEFSSAIKNGYFMMFQFIGNKVQLPYTLIVVFSSFMMALTFANEIEKGILRQYLSSPIPKRDIFFGKLLAVTVPMIAVSSAAIIVMLFMIDPSHFFSVPHIARFIAAVIMTYILLIFAIAGLGIVMSLISRNTAITAISTFMVFYLFSMIGGRELPYIPPYSMSQIAKFFMGISHSTSAILFLPLFAVITIAIGYYFFVKEVELP
jgi:ABC-type transport system involved in multi-copper enzyme maturation permease subunit